MRGTPCFKIMDSTNALATELALMSFKGTHSGYQERKPMHVKRYLLPFVVEFNEPTISIEIRDKGVDGTAVLCVATGGCGLTFLVLVCV